MSETQNSELRTQNPKPRTQNRLKPILACHIPGHLASSLDDSPDIFVRMGEWREPHPRASYGHPSQASGFETHPPFFYVRRMVDGLGESRLTPGWGKMGLKKRTDSCDRCLDPISTERRLDSFPNLFTLRFD